MRNPIGVRRRPLLSRNGSFTAPCREDLACKAHVCNVRVNDDGARRRARQEI